MQCTAYPRQRQLKHAYPQTPLRRGSHTTHTNTHHTPHSDAGTNHTLQPQAQDSPTLHLGSAHSVALPHSSPTCCNLQLWEVLDCTHSSPSTSAPQRTPMRCSTVQWSLQNCTHCSPSSSILLTLTAPSHVQDASLRSDQIRSDQFCSGTMYERIASASHGISWSLWLTRCDFGRASALSPQDFGRKQ